MSTEPNNGGPIKRTGLRRTVLEAAGLVSLIAAAGSYSTTAALATAGVVLLWMGWSS